MEKDSHAIMIEQILVQPVFEIIGKSGQKSRFLTKKMLNLAFGFDDKCVALMDCLPSGVICLIF
ncbi:hypothetical protein ACFBZI_05375 [Moraxella sp. ZJ142]|uniref:hypothetical protein n=1 Tax=Moraxella marmotae TaxID=3344520 RepID=UPI0035D4D736